MDTYQIMNGRVVITYTALSTRGADRFRREVLEGVISSQSRWSNAMTFLRCGVDWPEWQHRHREAFDGERLGISDFYDPWKTSDEFSGLKNVKPLDFSKIYEGLSIVSPDEAEKYTTVAYHSRQLLEPKMLNEEDVLNYEQLVSLQPSGLVSIASSAPLELLLRRAKSSDFAHCFAQLGLSKAKNVALATEYIAKHSNSSKVIAAMQSSPKWRDWLYLRAPRGQTWESFQDFRFVLKGMAQDFESYVRGFPIFQKP